MEKDTLTIYSYEKTWKVEKKIYSISSIVLPIPINPYDLLYFGMVIIIAIILTKMLPFLANVPPVLMYVAFPYIIANYLMKKKLDGLNPIVFFLGYIKYQINKGTYIQNFMKITKQREHFSMRWKSSIGIRN